MFFRNHPHHNVLKKSIPASLKNFVFDLQLYSNMLLNSNESDFELVQMLNQFVWVVMFNLQKVKEGTDRVKLEGIFFESLIADPEDEPEPVK